MPALDPRYLDHFQNPRHATRLEDPDVEVSTENPVCGDELTLGLRVREGRIEDLGFRARGCSGSIASASALCELVLGQPLAFAAEVDRATLEEALGSLPQLKRHGADLAVDALRRALAAVPAAPPHPSAASAAHEEQT